MCARAPPVRGCSFATSHSLSVAIGMAQYLAYASAKPGAEAFKKGSSAGGSSAETLAFLAEGVSSWPAHSLSIVSRSSGLRSS